MSDVRCLDKITEIAELQDGWIFMGQIKCRKEEGKDIKKTLKVLLIIVSI